MSPDVDRELEEAIKKLDHLPTLPSIAAEVLEATRSSQTSAQEVQAIISRDPALSSRVLKLVNSAYYGLPQRIQSITQAVVILGFNQVKNIVLTVSVFEAFGTLAKGMNIVSGIWAHSLGTAICARTIGRFYHRPGFEDLFVAGLLHDFGRIFLIHINRRKYADAISAVENENISLRDAEKQVLGLHHEKVGQVICQKWNLPETMVESVGYHHRPMAAKSMHQDNAMIIHLANALCHGLLIGDEVEPVLPIHENVWQSLGLGKGVLRRLIGQIQGEAKRAADFFQMIDNVPYIVQM